MTDFSSSIDRIEKLYNSNYNYWSKCIWFYLLGEELWDIVRGANTMPSMDVEELREWKIKVGKAL